MLVGVMAASIAFLVQKEMTITYIYSDLEDSSVSSKGMVVSFEELANIARRYLNEKGIKVNYNDTPVNFYICIDKPPTIATILFSKGGFDAPFWMMTIGKDFRVIDHYIGILQEGPIDNSNIITGPVYRINTN
jgi:hypothetical protein